MEIGRKEQTETHFRGRVKKVNSPGFEFGSSKYLCSDATQSILEI